MVRALYLFYAALAVGVAVPRGNGDKEHAFEPPPGLENLVVALRRAVAQWAM
jgi:hypothetical protein